MRPIHLLGSGRICSKVTYPNHGQHQPRYLQHFQERGVGNRTAAYQFEGSPRITDTGYLEEYKLCGAERVDVLK